MAVNRTAPSEPGSDAAGDPFLPAERVDLATAIGAFTLGSAYVNHLDHATGSVSPGKYADLIVLDRNVFELDPADGGVTGAEVVLTFVGGRRCTRLLRADARPGRGKPAVAVRRTGLPTPGVRRRHRPIWRTTFTSSGWRASACAN